MAKRNHFNFPLFLLPNKLGKKHGDLKQTYHAYTKQCCISTGQQWNGNNVAIRAVTVETMGPVHVADDYNGTFQTKRKLPESTHKRCINKELKP